MSISTTAAERIFGHVRCGGLLLEPLPYSGYVPPQVA